MLEAGLVTRKAAVVNWDPVDMTVLANEQVIDGRGWRSGAPVERRELIQWFFRITDMADELLDGARRARRTGPTRCGLMQRNWIGKSRGLQFRFETTGAPAGFETLEVFTTRPDTLWGATFAAVAPDHPLAEGAGSATRRSPPSSPSAARAGTSEEEIETAEKRGIDTGIRVIHPLDPAVELPVWIANFILMDYGTGAIFGCPAHDQRDLDFVPQVRAAGDRRLRAARLRGAASRTIAFVPPKTEPVDYLRPVTGVWRMTGEEAVEAAIDFCEARGIGEGVDQVPAARLGHLAPALLGLPDPGAALPGLRRGAGGARQAAGAAARRRELRPSRATRSSAIRPGRRRPARAAAARRGARPTRWTPSSTRPGTTRASPRRTRRGRPTWPTPTTG